jgi:hypothetical protein
MARELGRISLAEALELTILIAAKEPKRLPRVAVRWLERFLQETEPTLAQVGLAVSALSALGDEEPREPVRLRACGRAAASPWPCPAAQSRSPSTPPHREPRRSGGRQAAVGS